MCIQRTITSDTVTLAAGELRQVIVNAPSGLAVIGGGWSQGGDAVKVVTSKPRTTTPEAWEFVLKNDAASAATVELRAICTIVV